MRIPMIGRAAPLQHAKSESAFQLRKGRITWSSKMKSRSCAGLLAKLLRGGCHGLRRLTWTSKTREALWMDGLVSFGSDAFTLAPGQRFLGVDLANHQELAKRDAPALAQWLSQMLQVHKAILLRNSGCFDAASFEALLERLCPDRMPYEYASTPRSSVGNKVYTSTEYPASQHIPMHNELSYARQFPRVLWFFCERPAQVGGATPIADSHKVFKALDQGIVKRFATHGVKYLRNYNIGVDLTWQRAFGVETREEAELACARLGLSFVWMGADQLRTWQVCPAIQQDPVTGECVWFNQAHLFHPSGLQASVREALEEIFEPEGLPRTARYGNGDPIEDSVLEEIRAAYASHSVPLQWQAGDLALLDNRGVAHGREPFSGPRRVLVAMQGQVSSA